MEKTSEIWAQGEDSVQEREGMDNRAIEEQEGMKRLALKGGWMSPPLRLDVNE